MLKPPRLKHGSTLGIIAPSSNITKTGEQTIERGYERLRKLGFNIIEAPQCRKVHGHTAGTIEERAETINEFFRDPQIDGIMAFWGGFQSHQLLEHLDYAAIKKNPKVLIGYSDVTALTTGIYAKTGLVTFSGPGVITFAKPKQFKYTTQNFKDVLMNAKAPLRLSPSTSYSDNKWFTRPDNKMIVKKTAGWKTYRSGIAEGEIIGGNLGTMLLLNGTPYWPDLKGKILFAEEDEAETPRTIDRMFTQLRQMGVFKQIKGLVVGRFMSEVNFTKNDSFEMILDEALRGYDIPVLYDVNFGHSDPLFTIPIGVRCKLDAQKKTITYLERAVR